MAKEISITIENRLLIEKRDMNIYHHSTKSAHMISYDSSIALPLKLVTEDDYLHISIVSGPGDLENKSVVNLPSWVNFEFTSGGKDVIVTHSEGRTLLRIPPGPTTWEIKITRSATSLTNPFFRSTNFITVGDD